MYFPGVEFLLWAGCYVLSLCGIPLVGRLLCTLLVWRFCCGEVAKYCPGSDILLWGGCYILSWSGISVFESLLCIVVVCKCCCVEAAL